jgi:predicted permease
MLKDLRYAVRMLLKNPGFVIVAVCSLAIGIGANSAIYSLADAILLRPMAVLKPGRVISVIPATSGAFGAGRTVSYPDYIDLRDRNRTFDGLVASSYAEFGFTPDRQTQPRMKFGMFVSGNFFKVLGIEPTIGRGFRPEEDRTPGRDAVLVLSHELWAGEFGASPSAIGRTIWLSGTEFTIIGIAPEAFRGVDQVKPALYVPVAMAAKLWSTNNLTQRDLRWLEVRGRLKPGINTAQASADVAAIATGLRRMYPKTDETLRLRAETQLQVRLEQSPPDAMLMTMLGLLAVCVLLVACANVAGLLLSRSAVRAREIAVRLAIGASRWSVIRQLLIENLLLAAGGAAVGLAVASAAIGFFDTLSVPTDVPLDLTARLDQRVFVFTLLVALVSTFIFGLVPALRTTRLDLIGALKERDGTASRSSRLWGRNLLVAGQVALSLVLLIVSGILLQGFRTELNQGPGFRTGHLQLMNFNPGLVHYTDRQRDAFYKHLLEGAERAPGVQSATLAATIPMMGNDIQSTSVVPEGRQLRRGERAVEVFKDVVTPGYFDTMAIPVVHGRAFLDSDKVNTPAVAIVNEEMARHFWPGQSALGKRVRLGDAPGRLAEVVGIAKMSKYLWISEGRTDFLYLPFSQNPQPSMFLVAQSKGPDAAALVPVLRQVVQKLDRNMPVFDVRTMESLYQNRAVATPNLITNTVAGMGVMGLVLAVIGLYGVISYSVSRRSREFGIRMAIGADRHQVAGMVLRQGLVLGIGGIAVGLVAGIFVSKAVTSSLLFSFGRIGIAPFAAVSVLLLVTTALGAYLPARRASRIDPMRALREE